LASHPPAKNDQKNVRSKPDGSNILEVLAVFVIDWTGLVGGGECKGLSWFFDNEERLGELSAKGDELEQLNTVVKH
jgi:hypothetical protein